MRRYGYASLYRLWLANGGSRKLAVVMPAIALAESRGNPNAKHYNNDGSVDQGLWQINSSNYAGSDIYDPNVNARWAIRLAEHGRGLRNWTTFTSGKYKKFLPGKGRQLAMASGTGFGVFSQKNYAGTDQGVDFRGNGPIPALGSGVVTDVGRSGIMEGGQYPYVIYKLTSGPYKDHFVYVAENFVPTVRRGTRLKTGQEVGKAVGSYPYIEVGFNKTGRGWNPVAPLNPNPHSPKPAGNAMWSYIQGVAKLHPGGGGGITGDITGGLSSAGNAVLGAGSSALGFVTNPVGSLLGDATSGIAKALEKVGMEITYAAAIAGGGFIFILGLVLIGVDVGLHTKAGKITAAAGVVAATKGKVIPPVSSSEPKSNIPDEKKQRSEERKEEMHKAKLGTEKARATELRTRTKHRRATKGEQKKAEEKAYYAGARDAASPTMAKIKRERGKRKST